MCLQVCESTRVLQAEDAHKTPQDITLDKSEKSYPAASAIWMPCSIDQHLHQVHNIQDTAVNATSQTMPVQNS